MDVDKNGIRYTREELFNISNKLEKKLKNYNSKGKCMYGECTKDSIYSHTISKECSLDTIAIEREVICFDSKRSGLEKNFIYNKVNINNVTTFNGFCSTHDNQLFQCIDNNSDTKSGKEILLQSYRSVCKSLFCEGQHKFLQNQEPLNIEMIKKYLKCNDINLNDLNLNDELLMSMYNYSIAESNDRLSESYKILLKYKESIENDIKNNFVNINIDEIKCTNSKKITTSDKKVTILYKWFDWRIPVSLFNHHRLKGETSVDCILNFTYIPYKNSSEVFWIFSNEDFKFFYKYWDWFISKKINILNTIESCMMALENWCISPEVINCLPEERQNVLRKDMYFNNERTKFWQDYDMSIFDDIRMELIKNKMCDVEKERNKFNIPKRESDEVRKKKYEEVIYE